MRIFQYSKKVCIKDFNPILTEEEYLWKVIGKKNLKYEVKLIEGHGVHETATYIDEDKPWFNAKNHIYIQDFENEIKVTGGFIYDDEDIYHHYNEERKIWIKLDIDDIINKKIDNLKKGDLKMKCPICGTVLQETNDKSFICTPECGFIKKSYRKMFVVLHFGTGNEIKIHGTFDNEETAKDFMIKDVFRTKNELKDLFNDNVTIYSTHFGTNNCNCCMRYFIDTIGEQEENWSIEEIFPKDI